MFLSNIKQYIKQIWKTHTEAFTLCNWQDNKSLQTKISLPELLLMIFLDQIMDKYQISSLVE